MNNKYLLVYEENKDIAGGALSAILILWHTHTKAENIDPNTLPKDPNVVNGDAIISIA